MTVAGKAGRWVVAVCFGHSGAVRCLRSVLGKSESRATIRAMRHFDYQRTIIAYHGCDESVVRRVLLTGDPLSASENDYDWLGYGIYFWEFGPERALEWAVEQQKRNPKRIKKPAVIGAVIHLGNCFDLLDTRNTAKLEEVYEGYLVSAPAPLPQNQSVLHYLDCAVLNFGIPALEAAFDVKFQSVRGVFQEGAAAFTGSDIRKKSHIQIAVRDPGCILGYFKPQLRV